MKYKVGDTVYIIPAEDQDTLLLRRVVLREIKVDVELPNDIFYSAKDTSIFYCVRLDTIFDNPREAIEKALELKQW